MLNNSNGQLMLLAYVVLLAAIFYVMVIVPQRKRTKERQELISSLKVKDEIVTIGGVYGTITSIKEDIIMLKVDDKTTLKVAKDAVGAVVAQTAVTQKSDAKKDTVKDGKNGKE
jgi:preprotein translocase subunit YajC